MYERLKWHYFIMMTLHFLDEKYNIHTKTAYKVSVSLAKAINFSLRAV